MIIILDPRAQLKMYKQIIPHKFQSRGLFYFYSVNTKVLNSTCMLNKKPHINKMPDKFWNLKEKEAEGV